MHVLEIQHNGGQEFADWIAHRGRLTIGEAGGTDLYCSASGDLVARFADRNGSIFVTPLVPLPQFILSDLTYLQTVRERVPVVDVAHAQAPVYIVPSDKDFAIEISGTLFFLTQEEVQSMPQYI